MTQEPEDPSTDPATRKYQVIARRYRPRGFDEVVGQESVAATLRNAILQNRLAHAYLFTGSRGIGKTSMARIFAKALNCPRAADRKRPREEWGLPCNECDACRAIHAGEDIDVLEMDGASYRGIDEIRDIIENVKFIPSRSPYKIFIIDEVHMLTREAFNALLKTLEEPPGHVKFFFATTEPHKIPDTVVSRCQRFDLRQIGEDDIVKRLGQICELEGVTAEPGLLLKIARCGKGGLRDAQSLLDQVITFSDETLRSSDLERITGRLPESAVDSLIQAIDARNPQATLQAVEDCFSRGADPSTLLEQVIERLHGRFLQLAGGSEESGETQAAARADVRADAGEEFDLSLGRLQVLNETALKLRTSPYPRLTVELVLLKLSRMENPRALNEALGYLKGLEERLGSAGGGVPAGPRRSPPESARGLPPGTARRTVADGTPGKSTALKRTVAEGAAGRNVPEGASSSGPAPDRAAPEKTAPEGTAPEGTASKKVAPEKTAPDFDFIHLSSLWDQIIIESRQRFPKMAALLGRSRPREGARPGRFTLALDSEFNLSQLRERRRVRELEGMVKEVAGAPWKIDFTLGPESPPENGKGSIATGGGRKGSKRKNPGGPSSLDDHPLVKKSLDLFKGKIV